MKIFRKIMSVAVVVFFLPGAQPVRAQDDPMMAHMMASSRVAPVDEGQFADGTASAALMSGSVNYVGSDIYNKFEKHTAYTTGFKQDFLALGARRESYMGYYLENTERLNRRREAYFTHLKGGQ